MKVAVCILVGLMTYALAVETEINFNFAGMIPGDSDDECEVCPVCPEEPITVYSEDQIITTQPMGTEQVGDYTARTFITYTGDTGVGVPEVIGWEFTNEFLTNPMAFSVMHEFPDTPAAHPFTGMGIDFTFEGHPPTVFQVPHFDIHFHTIPLDIVMTIVPGNCNGTSIVTCDVETKGMTFPPAGYLPSTFIPIGTTVPFMGLHWADPAILDAPFSMVFIFGSYDGDVDFYEPMIALSYIAGGDDICRKIALPTLFPETSYYPTRYCLRQGEDSFQFTMEDFEMRVGTPY